MVRRAPAKEVAALRRARRQAEARLYGAPRAAAEATEQRAEEALEAARADAAALDLEATERQAEAEAQGRRWLELQEADSEEAPAAKEEAARLERIAKDLRADSDTAAKVVVVESRRYCGIIAGRDSGARLRAARRTALQAYHERRAAVLVRRSLGWQARAAAAAAESKALEEALAAAAAAAAPDLEAAPADLEEVAA